MTGFNEREKGFERKFEQEQELAFKVKARRDKLLGVWAAERLGLAGDAALRYAQEVMQSDLQRHGSDDIVAKICADFSACASNSSAALKRPRSSSARGRDAAAQAVPKTRRKIVSTCLV
jgi:hypothetical protein